MKKLLLRLLIVALPMIAFWGLLQVVVMPLFHAGDALSALVFVFGGVVFLAVCEGAALRAWLLPWFGRVLHASVYGGSYSAADDPLAAMAARIRSTADASLLPRFMELVEQEPSRVRAWTELASLYADTFRNVPEALQALLKGSECADSDEDRAMLLYRAAQMRRTRMGDKVGAAELARQVSALYPRTVYGKKAARMSE